MARSADPNEVRENRPIRSDDRSLGELFSELTQETSTLVRQEVALAKTELSQKATRIGKDMGFLAAGGAIAYAGLLAIIAAIILGLIQLGVTWWLAAAIVGIVVAAIGGFLVFRGLDELKQTNPAPTQTLQSLKEDAQWTKDQI
jgi:Putative Actinobacterial Holin-X, holin superfamily III